MGNARLCAKRVGLGCRESLYMEHDSARRGFYSTSRVTNGAFVLGTGVLLSYQLETTVSGLDLTWCTVQYKIRTQYRWSLILSGWSVPGGSGILAPLVIKMCKIYGEMSQSSGTPGVDNSGQYCNKMDHRNIWCIISIVVPTSEESEYIIIIFFQVSMCT
jgi:hypothetical protein